MNDRDMAALGRAVGIALLDAWYSRKDDDWKRARAAEQQLCQACREEEQEAQQRRQAQ